MKSMIYSAIVAAFAMIAGLAPAAAETIDWWTDSIRQSRGGDTASTPRARARTQTASENRPARPARQARAVASTGDDDGSRPQRSTSTRTQPVRESLSGGESGVASYYWQPQRLAGGGWFNPDALTAAHKTLPLGTRVRVTRVDNGNSVDVTINDRGPYVAGRVIDLSRRAAQSIDMTGQGLARVRVAVLGR